MRYGYWIHGGGGGGDLVCGIIVELKPRIYIHVIISRVGIVSIFSPVTQDFYYFPDLLKLSDAWYTSLSNHVSLT